MLGGTRALLWFHCMNRGSVCVFAILFRLRLVAYTHSRISDSFVQNLTDELSYALAARYICLSLKVVLLFVFPSLGVGKCKKQICIIGSSMASADKD